MATLTLGKSVTIGAVQSKKGDAVFVERRRRIVAPGNKELRDEPKKVEPATVPIGDLEKVQALDDVHLIGHITEEKFGHILVTRDDQEFELKAQGWNPLS